MISGQQDEESLSSRTVAAVQSWTICTDIFGLTQSSLLLLHGIKLINPHWRRLTYIRKEKKGVGASFGLQLPRDGMKILKWSSNPKLPSKNIPLPPRQDPDLFLCTAEAGVGWVALAGGRAGDRRGQTDGRRGQVQFAGLRRPLT